MPEYWKIAITSNKHKYIEAGKMKQSGAFAARCSARCPQNNNSLCVFAMSLALEVGVQGQSTRGFSHSLCYGAKSKDDFPEPRGKASIRVFDLSHFSLQRSDYSCLAADAHHRVSFK